MPRLRGFLAIWLWLSSHGGERWRRRSSPCERPERAVPVIWKAAFQIELRTFDSCCWVAGKEDMSRAEHVPHVSAASSFQNRWQHNHFILLAVVLFVHAGCPPIPWRRPGSMSRFHGEVPRSFHHQSQNPGLTREMKGLRSTGPAFLTWARRTRNRRRGDLMLPLASASYATWGMINNKKGNKVIGFKRKPFATLTRSLILSSDTSFQDNVGFES